MKIERSKRIPFKKLVDFGSELPYSSAVTTNISDTGLHIQTNKIHFKRGTNLYITIHSGKEKYRCKGVVSWSKNVPIVTPSQKYGIGIKFSEIPEKFLEEYKNLDLSGFTCLTSD